MGIFYGKTMYVIFLYDVCDMCAVFTKSYDVDEWINYNNHFLLVFIVLLQFW